MGLDFCRPGECKIRRRTTNPRQENKCCSDVEKPVWSCLLFSGWISTSSLNQRTSASSSSTWTSNSTRPPSLTSVCGGSLRWKRYGYSKKITFIELKVQENHLLSKLHMRFDRSLCVQCRCQSPPQWISRGRKCEEFCLCSTSTSGSSSFLPPAPCCCGTTLQWRTPLLCAPLDLSSPFPPCWVGWPGGWRIYGGTLEEEVWVCGMYWWPDLWSVRCTLSPPPPLYQIWESWSRVMSEDVKLWPAGEGGGIRNKRLDNLQQILSLARRAHVFLVIFVDLLPINCPGHLSIFGTQTPVDCLFEKNWGSLNIFFTSAQEVDQRSLWGKEATVLGKSRPGRGLKIL